MTQDSEANKAFTMPPIDHARDLRAVVRILEETPAMEREYMAPREEFETRAHRVNAALRSAGHPVGFVFSDEHYRGDAIALAVFERAGRAIGSALSVAISLLDPEIVILGGDLILAEDIMLPIIWDQIRLLTRPRSLELVQIVVSRLGLDIRLKGAASLAFRNMLEVPELVQRLCAPAREATPTPGRRRPRPRAMKER